MTPDEADKTIPIDREAFEAELQSQHRATLPIPFVAVIAEAQGIHIEPCCMCHGAGLVAPERNAAYLLHLADDFEADAPITAVDDVTTQPVRGR